MRVCPVLWHGPGVPCSHYWGDHHACHEEHTHNRHVCICGEAMEEWHTREDDS